MNYCLSINKKGTFPTPYLKSNYHSQKLKPNSHFNPAGHKYLTSNLI